MITNDPNDKRNDDYYEREVILEYCKSHGMNAARNILCEKQKIDGLESLLSRLYQIDYDTIMQYYCNNHNYAELNAYIDSLLTHLRVINEFFEAPIWKHERKNIKYEKDAFYAIHCLSDDEYLKFYELYIQRYLYLTKVEKEDINKRLMHSTVALPLNDLENKLNYTSKSRKAMEAVKIFINYQSVILLIDRSILWTDNNLYSEIVNTLKEPL